MCHRLRWRQEIINCSFKQEQTHVPYFTHPYRTKRLLFTIALATVVLAYGIIEWSSKEKYEPLARSPQPWIGRRGGALGCGGLGQFAQRRLAGAPGCHCLAGPGYTRCHAAAAAIGARGCGSGEWRVAICEQTCWHVDVDGL